MFMCCPSSTADRAEIEQKVEELGGVKIDETHGYFPVKPSISQPQILEYNEAQRLVLLTNARMLFVKTKRKVQLGTNYILREGLFSRIFKKTCTMYHDPVIKFVIYPTRITKAVVHLFSFKITGDVEVRFDNQSKEGEEGKTTVWRWQSCPTDENAYEWEIVKGSADLTPSWSHDFIEDSTSVRFRRISSSTSKVETRSSASVSGSWNT